MAKKKNSEITVRSSAAEYLTYIAATGDDPQIINTKGKTDGEKKE